ncbi:unnamed protein product [Discula destructiva]
MTAVRVARSFTFSRQYLNVPLGLPGSGRLTGATPSFPAVGRGAFATSPKSDPKKSMPGSTDTELPKFDFKNLGATPTVRWFLRGSILIIAMVEGATYVKFLPKVFGKSEGKSSNR